ncbi:hypothetical protein CGH80_16410, partial [Vibrio parahaemolyticus]
FFKQFHQLLPSYDVTIGIEGIMPSVVLSTLCFQLMVINACFLTIMSTAIKYLAHSFNSVKPELFYLQ